MSSQWAADSEQVQVVQKSFFTERDFAEAEDIDAAYLTRNGIAAIGVQNRLLKRHRELSNQYARHLCAPQPTPPTILLHSPKKVQKNI